MIQRIRKTATMFFLAAGFAVAATQKSAVDGRWQETFMTANGPVTVTYHLKVKGISDEA